MYSVDKLNNYILSVYLIRLVPGPGVPVLSPDAAEPPDPGHEPALPAPALLVVTVQGVVRAVSGGRGVGHRAHTRALQQQRQ